jgi:hypothetical protein
MKQKRIVLTRSPENQTSKLPESIRLYINSPTENKEFGDKLTYMDGAIPFLVTFFEGPARSINTDFIEINDIINNKKKKLSKEYILRNYWVYRIGDYGSQSLSAGFTDLLPICFFKTGENAGYKLPQDKIATFRNYTTKETFVIIRKKLGETVGPVLDVIIDFKRNDKLKNLQSYIINRINGKFVFNLDDKNISSIEEIDLFVREGVNEFKLTNSEYFFNIEAFEYAKTSGSEFISQQQKYFDFIQNAPYSIPASQMKIGSRYQILENSNTDFTSVGASSNNIGEKFIATGIPTGTNQVREVLKGYHNLVITLNDNLKNINQIILRGTREYREYFFSQYSEIRNVEFNNVLPLSVYRYNSSLERSVRLIPGIDFYLDSAKKLFIKNALNSDLFEVILRTIEEPSLSVVFSVPFGTSRSFFLRKRLYDNNVAKWNVILPGTIDSLNKTTRVYIFKNGLLDSFLSRTDFTVGTYEYVVESMEYDENAVPTNDVNTVVFITSNETFNTFNKYQITTDPYLNTYGQFTGSNFNTQEVYLYDKNMNFKIEPEEPFIEENSGTIKIQDITDFYPSFLSEIETNYDEFQNLFDDGKNKIIFTLHENTKVQTIETEISKLKNNFKAIFQNGAQTFIPYTGETALDSFLFLVFTGTNGSKFNIVFTGSSGNIIKKEYGCEIVDNLYISIPFFLDTLSDSNVESVRFRLEMISGSSVSYCIFR